MKPLCAIPESWTRWPKQTQSQESISSVLWDTWPSVHASDLVFLLLCPLTCDAVRDSASPTRRWAPSRWLLCTSCHFVSQHRERHLTLWCNNKMNEWMNECILVTKVFLSHQVIVLWGKKANEKGTSKKSCVQDCFLCLLTFSYEAWPLLLVEPGLLLKDILPSPSQKEGRLDGSQSQPLSGPSQSALK